MRQELSLADTCVTGIHVSLPMAMSAFMAVSFLAVLVSSPFPPTILSRSSPTAQLSHRKEHLCFLSLGRICSEAHICSKVKSREHVPHRSIVGCRQERWLIILPATVPLDEFLRKDPDIPVTVWTWAYTPAASDETAEQLEELYRQSVPDKVICLWRDEPDPKAQGPVGAWPFLLQLFKAHVRQAHAARLWMITTGAQQVHGAESHGNATAGHALPIAFFRTLFMEERGRSGTLLDVLQEDLPLEQKVGSFRAS